MEVAQWARPDPLGMLQTAESAMSQNRLEVGDLAIAARKMGRASADTLLTGNGAAAAIGDWNT